MSIRKTANELVEAMFQSGVSFLTIKKVLDKLGFPKERIEELTESLPTGVSEEPSEKTADLRKDIMSLQGELERHKVAIESLEEEIDKINSMLSPLLREIKMLKGEGVESIEKRLASLEAEVKGIVEALGEYVPTLLEQSSGGA